MMQRCLRTTMRRKRLCTSQRQTHCKRAPPGLQHRVSGSVWIWTGTDLRCTCPVMRGKRRKLDDDHYIARRSRSTASSATEESNAKSQADDPVQALQDDSHPISAAQATAGHSEPVPGIDILNLPKMPEPLPGLGSLAYPYAPKDGLLEASARMGKPTVRAGDLDLSCRLTTPHIAIDDRAGT